MMDDSLTDGERKIGTVSKEENISTEALKASNNETIKESEITEKENSTETGAGAIGGSEETFDMLCQACSEEDKHVEASMYCTKCDEYMCEPCVNMHRRVRLTKAHKLILKEVVHEKNELVDKNMREPCSIHIGEYVDLYCQSHHAVCCLVCMSMFHAKCPNVVTLSIAVNKLPFRQNVKEIVTKLETTQSQLQDSISERLKEIGLLDEDKKQSLQELENVRKEIEKMMENLQDLLSKDEKKIEKKYDDIRHNILFNLHQLKKTRDTLNESVKLLKNERLNDEYTFAHMVKAESNLKALKETFTETVQENANFEKIRYERDISLDEKLHAFEKLGHICNEKAIYTVSSPRKLTVVEQFQKKSSISAICLVEENQLLLVDSENCCLKLLNISDDMIQRVVNFQSRPFDICKIGDEKKIAVTLPQVRMVKIFLKEGMVFNVCGNIETGEVCRGIAYISSCLYVACGGRQVANEGPGHIRVYGLDGKLQKTILHDNLTASTITYPWKILLQPETDVAFVLDGRKILTISPKTGNQIRSFPSDNSLKQSLCFDPEGRVLVSCYKPYSVYILSTDGKRKALLLSKEDLISKPLDIAFDTKNSKLYVGLEDSTFLLRFDIEAINWKLPPAF